MNPGRFSQWWWCVPDNGSRPERVGGAQEQRQVQMAQFAAGPGVSDPDRLELP